MNKPLILGHRGAAAVAPENTICAFRRARELGADGVELDVTMTRDAVPVVIHDDTVDRTTNGHGAVRKLTVLEIKQLDAGAWKGKQFRGETIPTLAEVFDALADWLNPVAASRARRGIINVELKSATPGSDGLEREVVNLVVQKNLEDRVLLSSFNPFTLMRVKALNPQLKRGLLYAPDLPAYLSHAWLRPLAAPYALHPQHSMVNARLMKWARAKQYPINTWTVDEPGEAKRVASLGVAMLISNRPEAMRRALS